MALEDENKLYLLHGKGHLGPFPAERVEGWVKRGKINGETYIWKSGLNNWVKASQYFYAAEKKEKTQVVHQISPIRSLQLDKEENNIKRSYSKKIIAYLGVAFFLLISIPASMGIMKSFHVTKFDYAKINELLSLRPMMMKVNFAWDNDKQSLYLGFNKSWDGQIGIELQSVEGKIVSEKSIVITSHTSLREGQGIFNEFSFSRGEKIVEGHYHIKILNSDLKGKLVEDNFLVLDEEYYVYGPFYIGPDKDNFKRELYQFKEAVINNKEKFQFELIERLNTLSSLLIHLEDLFEFEVKKLSRGSDIESFNQRYGREVAMIMHGVTIDHRDEKYLIKEENSNLIKRYNKLTSIGKEIGEKVSSVVNGVKKIKKVTKVKQTELLNDFKQDISAIRKEIVSELSSLKN